jgi:DNA-binding MarR family transcriptional regulator
MDITKLSRKTVFDVSRKHDLSPSQVKVMLALFYGRKELSYTEIHKAAGIAYSGLTAILAMHGEENYANTFKIHHNSLEAKGLVTQYEAQEESQGRSPFVWGLSTRGKELARTIKAEVIELEEAKYRPRQIPRPSRIDFGEPATL